MSQCSTLQTGCILHLTPRRHHRSIPLTFHVNLFNNVPAHTFEQQALIEQVTKIRRSTARWSILRFFYIDNKSLFPIQFSTHQTCCDLHATAACTSQIPTNALQLPERKLKYTIKQKKKLTTGTTDSARWNSPWSYCPRAQGIQRPHGCPSYEGPHMRETVLTRYTHLVKRCYKVWIIHMS